MTVSGINLYNTIRVFKPLTDKDILCPKVQEHMALS